MSRGFTLFEIIIAISILSGVILMISMFSLDIYDFEIFLGENLTAQQELHLVTKVMVSELRSMRNAINGSYAIESASQNAITFYSDIDGDEMADRIRYFIDGNILKKGVIKPSGSPLSYSGTERITEEAHYIYGPAGNIFSYYDANYAGTGVALSFPINIPSVRLIKVNITVDQTPVDVQSRINLTRTVNLRNL